MQTSSRFSWNAYPQCSRACNSWWVCRSGHLHSRQYITWGNPLRWETCNLPSSDLNEMKQSAINFEIERWAVRRSYLGIVIHLVPGLWEETAFSSSSSPPLFLSFFTRLFTAFSLHFSSPSPRFQPSNRFTGDDSGINEVIIASLLHHNSRIPHTHCATHQPSTYILWLLRLFPCYDTLGGGHSCLIRGFP